MTTPNKAGGAKRTTAGQDAEAKRENYGDFYRASLDALVREYSDLNERFRRLDSKAQSVASTSGIFLAAVFAFVRQVPSTATRLEIGIIVMILFLLLVAVLLSLLATFVSRLLGPPTGEFVFQLAQDLSSSGRPASEVMIGFLGDQSRRWMRAIKSMREANRRKSRLVTAAQCTLFGAIIFVVAATVVSIIT